MKLGVTSVNPYGGCMNVVPVGELENGRVGETKLTQAMVFLPS